MGKFDGLRKDARQFAENIEVFARRRGAETRIEYGGKHPMLVFTRDGIDRKYGIPGTASDHRSFNNARADIKHMFAMQGWNLLEEAATTPEPEPAVPVPDEEVKAAPRVVRFEPIETVRMTPPPLSRPDAPNLRGWEVPAIPEAAQGTVKPGKKSNAYMAFLTIRNQWAETVLRAGATYEEIAAALSEAGHVVTEGAIRLALKKQGVITRTRNTVKSRVGNISTDDIKERLNFLIDDLVARRVAQITAERDDLAEELLEVTEERDQLRRRVEAFKLALKDV